MQLQGKKVHFLGDSITEGVGASSPANHYHAVFAKKSDACITVDGISGTRIARKINPNPEAYHDQWCFLDRVDRIPSDTEVVVIFGGTNDYGHGDAPLGTMANTAQDEYTFYGALKSLIIKIFNRCPKTEIVLMTPLHRLSEQQVVAENGSILIDFVNAIREVAEYFSLPVLDLFATSGFQPEIPLLQELYIPDGLHPNDIGAERIADRLIAFLQNL